MIEGLTVERPRHQRIRPVGAYQHAVGQALPTLQHDLLRIEVQCLDRRAGQIDRARGQRMADNRRIHIAPHCHVNGRDAVDPRQFLSVRVKLHVTLGDDDVLGDRRAEDFLVISVTTPGEATAAQLLSRELVLVDERDAQPGLCGDMRSGSASGATADHDHIVVRHQYPQDSPKKARTSSKSSGSVTNNK